MSESTIQSTIKADLKRLGYTCYSTSTYNRNRRGAVERGIPDLLVTHHGWPKGAWLGLEVKQPKGGRNSVEQDALESSGRIVVVTSTDQALVAIGEVGIWK